MRVAAGGPARGPVHRPDPRPGVGGDGRGVEGGVFDLVTHGEHVVLTHRFHVHQGAAVIEPELAVVVIVHAEPEVHELGRRADVELQALEDGLDRITLEPQSPLHAPGVHGTGSHPLLDGDVAHRFAPQHRDHVRHPCTVDEVSGQQVLRQQ